MAIVYVGGQEGGRAGSTSTTNINFALTGGTDSTPQAGDLVIITSVVGSQGRNPAQAISGYTALGQLNPTATTYDTSLDVSYKFMGGTPDTTFTLPSTGNVQDAQSYTVQVFRGVDAATPFDVASVSATGTGTSRPDPASITPSTAGAWVLICGGGAAGTGANYTAPTNFTTNFLTGTDPDTNDSLIGCGYWSGWTSGAVNPAAYTGGSNTTSDSWAAYTIALRPAPPTQALTPSLYSDSEVFYGPTVVKNAYPLTPNLFSDAEVFYAATVTPGPRTLTPTLYSNDSTFYSQTVTAGAVNLQSSLYSNAQAFYAPTVDRIGGVDLQVSWVVFDVQASGNVNLLPALFENQTTFYSANVATGPVTLTASRYDNAQAFYTATVGRGTVTLTPARHDNTQTFFGPTVSRGAVNLQPARYDNAQTFYAHTLTPSNTLQPSRYDNASAFYSAVVGRGTINLAPGRLDNAQVFYTPLVTSGQAVIAPSRYDNANIFYNAIVASGAAVLQPDRYDNLQLFYPPTVTTAAIIAANQGGGFIVNMGRMMGR